MSTIIDVMLAVRERKTVYYHKDTNSFDCFPISQIQLKNLKPDFNEKISMKDTNNFALPPYEEINHEGIMRFYVRECVYDKTIRKQLFDILRRDDYIDLFLDKLRDLDLYDEFVNVCGDIYYQIFDEWVAQNELDFTNK